MTNHNIALTSKHWMSQLKTSLSTPKPSIVLEWKTSIQVGATVGASLMSTTSNSHAGGSSSHSYDQLSADLLQKETSILLPLAKSMRELADCQWQMLIQRAVDWDHKQGIWEQRQQSEAISECFKRTFEQRAKLLDQARRYGWLNAELNPSDDNTKRLLYFYLNKCQLLQEEIDAAIGS